MPVRTDPIASDRGPTGAAPVLLDSLDRVDRALLALVRQGLGLGPKTLRGRAPWQGFGRGEWAALFRRAEAHRVEMACCEAVRRCEVEMEAGVRARMEQHYHRRLQQSMMLMGELGVLTERLVEHGIEPLTFKGPVLATRAYGSVALRPFSDIDLLVRLADVPRTVDVLEEAGYEAIHPLPAARAARWDTYMPLWHHPHANANGYRRPDGITVDLHWGLVSRYYQFPQDAAELWPRAVPVDLPTGRRVRAMSPEDALLFLCLHAAKHHWRELRFACDIALHLRAHPDLDAGRIRARARRLHAERMLDLGYALADAFFGVFLPEERRRCVGWDKQRRALMRLGVRMLFGGVGTLEVLRFQMAVRDRARDAVGALVYNAVTALRPTREDHEWLRLPKRLERLYPLVRLARKAVGGWVSETDREVGAP